MVCGRGGTAYHDCVCEDADMGGPGARSVSATPVDWGLARVSFFARPAATAPAGREVLVLFVSAVDVGGVTPRALRWRSGNGPATRTTGGGGSTARIPRPSRLRFCALFGAVRAARATGGGGSAARMPRPSRLRPCFGAVRATRATEEEDRPRGCLALPDSVLVLVLCVGLESGGDELLSPCDSSLDGESSLDPGKFEWLAEEEP